MPGFLRPFFFLRYASALFLLPMLACRYPTATATQNAQQQVLTRFVWSGAVTPHAAKVTTQLEASPGAYTAQLVVATDTAFAAPRFSATYSVGDQSGYLVTMVVDGLDANTLYYYRVLINGQPDTRTVATGSFRTFPAGPASFTFAMGGCATSDRTFPVFDAIRQEQPLFFLYTGDFHYGNIAKKCTERQRHYYTEALRHRNDFHRLVPVAYMWDDHDYGPNNSDGSSPCKMESLATYRQVVPHYDLPLTGAAAPVSQSFVVGRLRFVLPDLRSQKREPSYAGCERTAVGSNFGTTSSDTAHWAWFKNELLAARQQGQLAVFVSGIPFINHPGGPNYTCREDDDWGGYPEERRQIADFVQRHNIPLLILSGDAHMVAIDDGRNSNYASQGDLRIPVFQAAPLGGRNGSYKGGPYSHGYRLPPWQVIGRVEGQYGLVRVTELGAKRLRIEFEGRDHHNQVLLNKQGQPLVYAFEVLL